MQSYPVVLVTGASRGLGRGIAENCSRIGCNVAIHYQKNESAALEAMKLCQSAALNRSQQFALIQGNIARSEDRARILSGTLAKLGRLDALVNNAGIAVRVRADITETTEESYDEVMNVNLKGPYFLSQIVARHWLAHSGGSLLPGGYKLIFITSISAEAASINRGEYCLSKAGLAMACQLWAARLATEGTQVFEIRPGIMETDMTAGVRDKYNQMIADGVVPQGRWGKPEDAGLAVKAILQGHFPFSTGAVIPVDGGFGIRRL